MLRPLWPLTICRASRAQANIHHDSQPGWRKKYSSQSANSKVCTTPHHPPPPPAYIWATPRQAGGAVWLMSGGLVSWLSSEECSAVGRLHTSHSTVCTAIIMSTSTQFCSQKLTSKLNKCLELRNGQFKIFKLFLFSLLPPLTVRVSTIPVRSRLADLPRWVRRERERLSLSQIITFYFPPCSALVRLIKPPCGLRNNY